MISDIFNILLPQFMMGFTIILLLVLSMIMPLRKYKYARLISIVGISFTIIFLSSVQTEPQYFAFNNSLMSDSYTLLFDFVILLCGFFVALLTKNLVMTRKSHAYTIQALLLSAILGAINIVSANDFLTLLVSMELLGFSTYFLISVSKGYPSKEAAFKYLITSALSTGIFLFGVSYIYGVTGTINFSEIYRYITENDVAPIYSIGCIATVLGLSSKLAIFPFANWVIDVYKGVETSILAFLSTIPKLAVFGILCRLIVFPMGNVFELTFIIAILSLITAFWANTYAIRENNVKVILACSASANASYALLTASLVSVYNLSTVLFYVMCYAIIHAGVFAFLNIYGDKNAFEVSAFKGLFHKNHGLVGAYAILILALAGIPITSGFIAKIYLFTAITNSGLIFVLFLALLLLLMVIALFYYLKILLPLFDECDKNQEVKILQARFPQKFTLIILTLITVIIGIYPEILIQLCRFIAYNI